METIRTIESLRLPYMNNQNSVMVATSRHLVKLKLYSINSKNQNSVSTTYDVLSNM